MQPKEHGILNGTEVGYMDHANMSVMSTSATDKTPAVGQIGATQKPTGQQ